MHSGIRFRVGFCTSRGFKDDINHYQAVDKQPEKEAKYQFINLSHIDNRLFNGPAPLHKKTIDSNVGQEQSNDKNIGNTVPAKTNLQ